MNIRPENHCSSSTNGHLLRLSETHLIAIYTRDGVCWVAEFRNGCAALFDATTFFHFHAGALRFSHGRRAAALQSATPLTQDVFEKIERLHQSYEVHDAEIWHALVTVIESFKHCFRVMMPRIRGQASKTNGANRLSS